MLDQTTTFGDETSNPTTQRQFDVTVSRKSLFLKLLKFSLLTMLTMGFYRFWAKTKLRKYLWENTSFKDDPFEYLGRAEELFIGFFIAIAVLIPLAIIDGLARYLLEAFPNEYLTLAYNILYVLVIFFLIEFATYRMRRYQLTRTAWRGIRFHLDGSALQYALKAVLWDIALILSLGLCLPWQAAWTNQQFMNNAHFGNAVFHTTVKGKDFVKPYLSLFLINLFILGAVFLFTFPLVLQGDFNIPVMLDDESRNGSHVFFFITLIIMGWLSFFLLNLFTLKITMNRIQIGPSRLYSNFRIGRLLGFNIFYLVLVALFFILASAILFAVLSFITIGYIDIRNAFNIEYVRLEVLSGSAFKLTLMASIFVSYVLARILLPILYPITFLKEVLFHTSLDNEDALFKTVSENKDIPEYGEGIADAMDVGAF